jgi:uncharacterized protein (TIGR02391 family)
LTRDFERAPNYQYVGQSGSTFDCIEAIMATLCSPNLPKKYTVIFKEWDRSNEESTSVAFIAWNWLGCEYTIIPDGFGTHHGTGGWGLSLCLALIRSCGIPIYDVRVSKNAFNRICNAKLTEEDIKDIKANENDYPMWLSYVLDEHEKGIEDGSVWRHVPGRSRMNRIPTWLIGPNIHEKMKIFNDNPAGAVSQAMLVLEDSVRKLTGFINLYGKGLMSKAFGKDGPLRFVRDDENESEGWSLLYMGVIGAIRNPLNHRVIDLNPIDAIRYIILCDMLLRQLFIEQAKKQKDDTGPDQI